MPQFAQQSPLAALPQSEPVPLGILMRLAVWLVGADRDHIALSPHAERSVVVWSALSLLAAFSFCAASWYVALTIARGADHLEHYAIAALFGFIILCLDRAMIRSHWLDYGAQMARQRRFSGFDGATSRHLGGGQIRWGFRLVVTLALTFSSAAFLELELFRNDTDAALLADNARQNQPVFAAAQKRAVTEADHLISEIQLLDQRAADLIATANKADTAKQAAALTQVSLLQTEREDLLRRTTEIAKAIACAQQDQIAEKYAVSRCDGQEAKIGKEGPKYKAASDQLAFLVAEQAAVVARNTEIDARLAAYQTQVSTALENVRPELADLATKRASLDTSLSKLMANRDTQVQALAFADPAYVPLPKGLIVRGDALDKMAAGSPWLAVRIWSVWVAFMVLDLSAMLVTVMVTPPLVYCVRQAAGAEVTVRRIIASSEADLANAMIAASQSRQLRLAAEEDDARHDHLRRTRALYQDRIDHHLANEFAVS